MAKQDALQGTLPLLVLTVLARRGPLHGYGITAFIASLSDVLRVEEGSLYPALHRLEEAGRIKARWATTDKGRRAHVRDHGHRRQLDAEESRWRAITAAVGHVLKHA